MRFARTWAMSIALIMSFAVVGVVSLAAEETSSKKESAAPAAPAKDDAAGACPYAENGACCGTCQEKKASQAHSAEGGCPCQRAKRMRQGS